MLPPSSRLHEDDGIRAAARFLAIVYVSVGVCLALYGVAQLALWLWHRPPAFWSGVANIAILGAGLVLLAVALEGIERAAARARARGLAAEAPATPSAPAVLPFRRRGALGLRGMGRTRTGGAA